MNIEVSHGEIVDKLTILQIKKENIKDPSKLDNLVKEYDFFIANAKLMPTVATTFGRVLGPASKMPSPQLGVVMNEDEKTIKEVLEKINSI
jgi:ribosomal protein L1